MRSFRRYFLGTVPFLVKTKSKKLIIVRMYLRSYFLSRPLAVFGGIKDFAIIFIIQGFFFNVCVKSFYKIAFN